MKQNMNTNQKPAEKGKDGFLSFASMTVAQFAGARKRG